jgi:hypothetical protein
MGLKLLTAFRLNVFLILIITLITYGALSDDNNNPPENIEGSILFQNKKDTIDAKDFLKDSTILPGDYKLNFSSFQDSAYYSALRLRIPATTRFYHDMMIFTGQWQFAPSDREATLEELANKSIQDLPDEYFMPSSTEKAMYEYNISQSLYVPYVQTYKPFGLKISMDAIGRFLGITEDLTPTISYSLFETSHVEIVIYSVQANVIATIFSGRQVPGNYSYTWNGRNDRGMMMGSGDYVGEVRIGDKRYVRKRIYIP